MYWYLIFMAWKAVNVDQALAKIVTTLLLADGCSLLPVGPPPPPPPITLLVVRYVLIVKSLLSQQYFFSLSEFFFCKIMLTLFGLLSNKIQ